MYWHVVKVSDHILTAGPNINIHTHTHTHTHTHIYIFPPPLPSGMTALAGLSLLMLRLQDDTQTQHTTLTRDRHPYPFGIQTRNPSKQASADPTLDYAATGINSICMYVCVCIYTHTHTHRFIILSDKYHSSLSCHYSSTGVDGPHSSCGWYDMWDDVTV